jgi:hypothetical protein
MSSLFFNCDLVKMSLEGPDVPVHVEIGYPERENAGVWVASLLIVTNREVRHRCEGDDPQHALGVALARLYNEFKDDFSRGAELVITEGGQLPFQQQLAEALESLNRHVACPLDLLARAEPSATRLLKLLGSQIDDSMLREIAAADYGCDADVHFERLKLIRDEGAILDANKWHPTEVLELIRWSQPEDPHWQPGATGERGHLIRAFACTVLLRSSVESSNRSHDYAVSQTLKQLLQSVAVPGDAAERASVSFLAWLVERAWESARALYALVFLMAALTTLRDRWSDEDVGRLASWVMAEDVRRRESDPAAKEAPRLWFPEEIERSAEWRACLEQLLDEAARLRSVDARRALEDLAMEILTAPCVVRWALAASHLLCPACHDPRDGRPFPFLNFARMISLGCGLNPQVSVCAAGDAD